MATTTYRSDRHLRIPCPHRALHSIFAPGPAHWTPQDSDIPFLIIQAPASRQLSEYYRRQVAPLGFEVVFIRFNIVPTHEVAPAHFRGQLRLGERGRIDGTRRLASDLHSKLWTFLQGSGQAVK